MVPNGRTGGAIHGHHVMCSSECPLWTSHLPRASTPMVGHTRPNGPGWKRGFGDRSFKAFCWSF